jgi:hypothetical protein
MIQGKKTLTDFANVELVVDADGLGAPAEKVRKYKLMTNSKVYPFIRFRHPFSRYQDFLSQPMGETRAF